MSEDRAFQLVPSKHCLITSTKFIGRVPGPVAIITAIVIGFVFGKSLPSCPMGCPGDIAVGRHNTRKRGASSSILSEELD